MDLGKLVEYDATARNSAPIAVPGIGGVTPLDNGQTLLRRKPFTSGAFIEMNEPALIREMLALQTIAVVGFSDRDDRPSNYVSAYMQQHGYTIYPVNPALSAQRTTVLGQPAVATLFDLPVKPEIVNVFRNASFLPNIVDEMLALGLTHLWVQQGIIDLRTATRAEQGGIRVVMDRCLMVEHRRLIADQPYNKA